VDFHSAYVAVNAADGAVSANAIEFLDASLKPELAQLLLPLIDPHVSPGQRAALAYRIVGAEIDSVHGAIEALLASDDSWLRETARAARERLWRPEHEPLTDPEMEPAALTAGL
jgi:hypothetical protein